MNRIEQLVNRYRNHISAPWPRSIAPQQRVIFVVYPPVDERRLRTRLGLFEEATVELGYRWKQLDLTAVFARWMSSSEYREVYFEEPDNISIALDTDFLEFVASELRSALTAEDVDDETVVAAYGVASLYGFVRVSDVLEKVVSEIRGRLVVFFPGSFDNSNYRLLDARDGWNYLAVPITLHNGVED